ncbi:hypothetical protein CMO91_01785 [Candidatus Woesearchaeota archaeon]|nr:hypothetical protein [Candidatus Woesearchaeota archaeon]|tara:strand:+ start:2772 stop:3053 length:282 start_codon:yes stop_codon:yes gene_type:complete
MDVCWLVERAKGGYEWSDTKKNARIHRKLGEPVTHDLSEAHESFLEKPEFVAWNYKPFERSLPKKGEVSFIVEEIDVEAQPPYIRVQYVVAKR